MAINKYIISGKGFLQELKTGKLPECIWSKSIRTAKSFTFKQADGAIEYIKNNIDSNESCFVWSPFEENYVTGLYEVVRRSSYYSIMDENYCDVLEWQAKKVQSSDSDIIYLNNTKEDKKNQKYYSYEEAIEIAKMKNIRMLKELIKIVND